jgi:GNAT superfamily N-acetyltransferase
VTATRYGAIETPKFVVVGQNDPLASPLLDELSFEYATRYGDSAGQEYTDLRAYPAAEFEPPGGVLVVATSDGEPVAGGAFRRYDPSTAELKRMWTASTHRRQGYGKLVVAELERIALQRGYARIYLTTGWRQPRPWPYTSRWATHRSTIRPCLPKKSGHIRLRSTWCRVRHLAQIQPTSRRETRRS